MTTTDLVKVNDTLRSLFGALGDPNRDKLAGLYYDAPPFMTDLALLNSYRGAWLPRKIVNIPARDAVRKWRDWNGDQKQIEAIEATEIRLKYRQKIEQARILARLFGGAAVYIGLKNAGPVNTPMVPERVGKDGISYLAVMSRVQLQAGQIESDPLSENYNLPKEYEINGVKIHPSRLIRFIGTPSPEPLYNFAGGVGWGDSVLLSMFEAIKQFDSTAANIASLVFESNVDTFGVPDFIDNMADPRYEKRLLDRFGLVAINKAINRSIIMDKDEIFERKQVAFAGLPDVLDRFFQQVSGASDIPATRLLGMSPAGMNSTGESDLRNYYDLVASEQTLEMSPAMEQADECIIRDALGSRPEEIDYSWASLWQVTDKERAEIGKTDAETAEIVNRTGLISQEALSGVLVTRLVEDRIFPGLEQAADEKPVDWAAELDMQQQEREFAITPPPAPTGRKPMKDAWAQDAAPKPVYIRRNVTNGAEIVAWAKGQGFDTTLLPSDLHVTIAYSKNPIDWFSVGEPWDSELKIAAGGPRMLETFGMATVLLFASREVTWRHRAVMEAGGSSEHDEFQPHITISWLNSKDISTMTPYQGPIVLGPEIFEMIDANWRDKVKEK